MQALADFLKRELHPRVPQTSLSDSLDETIYIRSDAYGRHLRDTFRTYLPDVYPDFRIRNMSGALGDELLVVNDEIIFRVPDSPAAVVALERENRLLCYLQERVPLPIPSPLYKNLKVGKPGQIFMGYRMLPGKPLYKEMLESIDGEETVDELVAQIVSFLYALHSMPPADLAPINLPSVHERKRYEARYEQVRLDLFPHIESDMCGQIATNFEKFLDTPQNFTLEPVLIHGSFGPQRILYDAKNRRIGGIIGFTRTGLGDPAYDFAALLGPQGYGKKRLQRFGDVYPGLSLLWERIQFYINALLLQEIYSQLGRQNMKNIVHKRDLLSLLTFSITELEL